MMSTNLVRISYNGPFGQLATTPSNYSITVRDICTNNLKYSSCVDDKKKEKKGNNKTI